MAQGLFFDLLKKPQNKKHKLTRRVGGYSSSSKNNNSNYSSNKRHQKKSDYVCNSDSFSEKVKKLYNCPTSVIDVKNDVKAVKAVRNSQPCYDDNKYVNVN